MPNTFIYANGDSFGKGSELGDFLLSSHPGYYNFNEERPSIIEKWFNEEYLRPGSATQKERTLKWSLINQEENTRNFSYKVSKKLNVKYLNSSKGGSSFYRIILKSLADLLEIKKTEKNIVALIVTSCPSRIEIPIAASYNNKSNFWRSCNMHIPNADPSADELIKYYMLNYDNYHQIVNFYKNTITLDNFCISNKIKLLWVAGNSNVLKTVIPEDKYINCPDFKNILEYFDKETFYSVELPEIARDININTMTPGYHFSEVVHEKAAELLLEKI